VSGLSTCRDCGQWIYWGEIEGRDGVKRSVPYSDSAHERIHWEDCTAQTMVTDELGDSYRVTKCKQCQHSVYWETTPRGKRRPMDVFMDEDTEEYEPAGVCHFETCTGRSTSNNWRSQDQPYSGRKKQETAGSGSGSTAGSSRQEVHDWEVKRLEPWLKDLKLTWPCQPADVTRAFRRLALETHPDMGGSDAAFIKVKRAYDQARKLMAV
jgi:hypothetical protein